MIQILLPKQKLLFSGKVHSGIGMTQDRVNDCDEPVSPYHLPQSYKQISRIALTPK
ncbi:MAG TPA: hypothetical protein V6C65_29095 [Allocoleopsis sp.]